MTDSFQPITGVRFSEVLATKLTVDLRLPMTGLEQADRNWLQPLLAFCGLSRPESERPESRHTGLRHVAR